MDRALIGHNMQALSKIYMNITIPQLGNFLGISAEQAEATIAKMIQERSIVGQIDQINQLVEFDAGEQNLPMLNSKIQNVCSNVD